MNKVIVDNLLVEKTNDDRFAINAMDAQGRNVRIELSAKSALEVARIFLNWVCVSWFE